MAQSNPKIVPNEDPIQQEVTSILRGLKHDLSLMGVLSLGKDGVLRSLTADRDIVDAVGLNPKQIEAFLSCMPASYQTGFEEADGTKIPKEEWFIPNPSLLPPPLSGEAKEQAREMMEHNPEVFEHKKEELKRAWENPGE